MVHLSKMRMTYTLLAGAHIALVAALPAPPGKNDPVVLDMSSYSDDILKRVNKKCDDPLVADADQDPEKIWEGLGCHELRGALDGNFSAEWDTTSLSYVDFISNRMHGPPPGWNCQSIDDSTCSTAQVKCEDTAFACGYHILNSIAKIHDLYKRGWQHMNVIHDRLQDIIGFAFTDTFAPDIPEDDTKFISDVLVGIVTAGAVGAGAFADGVMKTAMKATQKAFPTVRDGMLLSAGMGTPLALNHIDGDIEGSTVDAQLSDYLGKVYDQLRGQQSDIVKELFRGSTDGRLALYYMMNNGAFINAKNDDDWDEIEGEIMRLFLGQLIPQAWALAPTLQAGDNDAYSNVFFINSNKGCDEKLPDGFNDFTSNVKDFAMTCFEDEAWYLMVVHVSRDTDDILALNQAWKWEFVAPPGADKIFYGGYYGVLAEDLLASAYGGYKKGKDTQYWKLPEDDELVTGDGPSTYELHYTKGIREPGVVQLLICTNWEDAVKTIADSVDGFDNDEGNSPKLDKLWPCK